MPRVCSVCAHPDRAALDAALVSGEALRGIARRFAVSEDALFRHRSDHIPAALVKAKEAAQAADADDLLRDVRALRHKTLTLMLKAEQAGDYRTALAGIREARGCVELLAKLLGELDERPVVNLLVAPEWLVVRGALMLALHPFPDASTAVAAALRNLEARS